MLNMRQLQECIDEIRDGSEEAVKKLVNEYYSYYYEAAESARLSKDDAKHFANRATRSLFANIRSISDAESWQELADRELNTLVEFTPVIPEPIAPKKPDRRYEEESQPSAASKEEKPKAGKERYSRLFDDEEPAEIRRPAKKPKKPDPVYEEEETEEIRPIRKQKRPAPVYDEDDAEEVERSAKKKNRVISSILANGSEEEDETEEIRKPVRKQEKRKPRPVEEDDETEEIERPAKKKNKLLSAIFVTDDDDEEEDETEEIRKPVRKQEKKNPKPVYEEDETEEIKRPAKRQRKPAYDDGEDEDDDYDESGFRFPVWLLSLIAVLLLIGFAVLAVKIFLPDTWNSITGKDKPAATASPTPTPEVKPTETPEYTVAPEAVEPSPEPTPEVPVNSIIGTASVKVNNLNIRSKPSTSGDRAGTAVNGKSYDVYEVASAEGYTWYRISDNQWIADKSGQWVTYKAN